MKGVVFTEFFEFVEGRFSPEIAEQIIESSALPSKGIYTSIGSFYITPGRPPGVPNTVN